MWASSISFRSAVASPLGDEISERVDAHLVDVGADELLEPLAHLALESSDAEALAEVAQERERVHAAHPNAG